MAGVIGGVLEELVYLDRPFVWSCCGHDSKPCILSCVNVDRSQHRHTNIDLRKDMRKQCIVREKSCCYQVCVRDQ